MTPKQVELVQTSWKKVMPIQDTAASIFYTKLFELDPTLKGLFKGDIKEQGRKLMAMISVAVTGLTRLETIVPAVQDLGRRHVRYGVKDTHYDTVANALVFTLEKGLGPAFSAEVKEAWVTTYGVLARTMKDAAAKLPA
jgi:hemoglobin-like flavoprotein